MHWIFVLATQRKKASWRFSHLALISVTWQQSTLQSVERCCPQCAQKRGRWSSPELFLSLSPSPPTICLSALFMDVQILFLIYFENAESWRLAIQSLHAHREKPKRKQLCVCAHTHACPYQKIFQRRKFFANSLLLPNLLFLLLKTSCEEKNCTAL